MLVAEVSGLRYFFLLRLLRFVIVLRTPPNQIPSAVRRLMLRDKACVTTIICIKIYS